MVLTSQRKKIINHPELRKHLITLGLVSTLLIGVNSPVANAVWAQYQSSPLDTYNNPDLPVAYDITRVDFGVWDRELNTYEFYLFFKDPIKPDLFTDGLESFAGIFLDLNGDGQDDYSLETNPKIAYSGKKTHAGVFVTRANDVIAQSTRCAVKTWSDLGKIAAWIAFSVPKTCLPFGKSVFLKGLSDHIGGDNAEYDWAPELQWKLNLAAVKTGSSCTKAGITSIASGKKYTCIKSGKKLIWNKGVAVAVTPTPTPTPIPTLPNIVFPLHNVGTGLCDVQSGSGSTELRTDSTYVKKTKSYSNLWQKYDILKPTSSTEVDRAVIATFGRYVSQKRQSIPQTNISVQPGIADDTTMSRFYRELLSTSNWLSSVIDYPTFRKPVRWVIFRDWGWLKDEYISLGCDPADAAERSAERGADTVAWAWVDLNLANIYVNKDEVDNLKKAPEYSIFIENGSHEFFHMIQRQYIDLMSNWREVNPPDWIWEGGANLFAFLGLDYLGIKKFDANSEIHWPSQVATVKAVKLEDTNGTYYRYSLGTAGWEFLVSIVGFEKSMNIWKEAGKGKKFPDAFQDATGIELVDFYKMFHEIRPIWGL